MTPIDQIKSAYSENRTILGTVIHIGKEYLLVTVYDYPCIMSKDNVEPFFVRDFDVYFHKDVQVKILGIEENNSGGWNIWVSHKNVSEEKLSKNGIEGFKSVKKFQSYIGIISNITQYGIFVYLGSISGLIHATKLPKNYVDSNSIGDYVSVTATKINKEAQQIELEFSQQVSSITGPGERTFSHFDEFVSTLEEGKSIIHGKVVFIEQDCVTFHVLHESKVFSVYVKKDDLAWEKIFNPSDYVFLGEEIPLRFKEFCGGKLFFETKWLQQSLYPSYLFDSTIDEILYHLGFDNNSFYARIIIVQNKQTGNNEISGAIATNIISTDIAGKQSILTDPYTGHQIAAYVPRKYAYGIENGQYYKFSLEVSSANKRHDEHRPFMFVAIPDSPHNVYNPYKLLVEQSFKENKSPKSNRESASYLKEIGADLYTGRDRMFYELLQNADDSASQKGVRMMIQIKDNYLILTHDGLPFSRQDFRSIVSTANSTKRLDRKKTGYKGIGFKSVFTDSDKVYIRTGGFFFCFDKHADIFNDFRRFYTEVNPLYTPEQLDVFFQENSEYERDFEGVDHLPWQLLPFWQEDIPEDLRGTSFARRCNVAIALDLGVTISNYKEIIRGILQKPRFMLFLRNTTRIQFEDKRWNILSIAKHRDSENDIVCLKNSFADDEKEISYIVRDGNPILINNESFNDCGIPLRKECVVSAGKEKWKLYQRIDDIEVPVTSIPERIIASDTTTISYAFMLDTDKHINPISDKIPSLYAYLPMEDRRYLFPFFINADFELSSNRQEAKQSYWNQYLFYNIGLNMPQWLISVARESNPRYLELLPETYLTETLEEDKTDMLAVGFNAGLKKSIESKKFILNHEGALSSISEVMVDDSGLSYLIGANAFLRCLNFTQALVSPVLSRDSFKKDTLSGIKHISTETVISRIIDSKSKYIRLLKRWLKHSDKSDCERMLLWITKAAEGNEQLKYILSEIPGFNVSENWMSFNEVLENDRTIFNSKAIRQVIPLLGKIGFETTSEYIEDHQFYHLMRDGYFSVCLKKVLPKIQARIQIRYEILNNADIHNIFRCISSEYGAQEGVSTKDIKELALMRNRNGQFKAISQMIELDSSKYNNIADEFVISEKDAICPGISTFLMPLQQAYDDFLLIHWDELCATIKDETQAIALYTLTSDLYSVRKQHSTQNQDSNFPIAKHYYANGGFLLLNDVYIPRNTNLSPTEIHILNKSSHKPVVSSGVLLALKRKPFQVHNTNMDKAICTPLTLSLEEFEMLMEISKRENGKFFENFFVTCLDGNYQISLLPKDEQTYKSQNTKLVAFINRYCNGLHHLPLDLHKSVDFSEILTGDRIFTKLYPYLHEADGYQDEYLTIVESESSSVKREFLGKLLNVDLFEDEKKNAQAVRIIKLLSTVENITNEEYANLREKLNLVLNENHIPIVNIRTQRDLSIGNRRFSLSSLLPEDDKTSSILSHIIAQLKGSGLSLDFINSLFDISVDDKLCAETFDQLLSLPLVNGEQLAFVLLYSEANNKSLSGYKIVNANNQEVSLSGIEWSIEAHNFIKTENNFPSQYKDALKWLTLPFESNANSINIRQEIVDYSILKTNMPDDEKTALLAYLYNQWHVQRTNPSTSNLKYIFEGLGLSSKYLVLNNEYALESEHPDTYIQKWVSDGDTSRIRFLEDVLSMHGDDSAIVNVRKYLSGVIAQPTSITKSDILSAKIVDWIVAESLTLNEEQSDWLRYSIFDRSDFSIEIDEKTLQLYSDTHTPDILFDNWRIYRYPCQMPYFMSVSNPTTYICRKFSQDDITVLDKNIFINQDEWNHLNNLLRKLIQLDLGFSAEDYIAFQDYCDNSDLNLDGVGGLDSGLDKEEQVVANRIAREAAIHWLRLHGYTVPSDLPEYSCFDGVSKNGIDYPIVVKSFLSYANKLYLSPNQYCHLLRPNARLMLYTGNNRFYVLSREKILADKDFLSLRFGVKNLDHNGKLAAIARLLKDEYFEDTQFVFGILRDNQMLIANSLDDYNLSENGSEEAISSGNEEDVL